MMQEKLRGDDPSLGQYYTRAIFSRVEAGDDQIRTLGSNKALEHAVGVGSAEDALSSLANLGADVVLSGIVMPGGLAQAPLGGLR